MANKKIILQNIKRDTQTMGSSHFLLTLNQIHTDNY